MQVVYPLHSRGAWEKYRNIAQRAVDSARAMGAMRIVQLTDMHTPVLEGAIAARTLPEGFTIHQYMECQRDLSMWGPTLHIDVDTIIQSPSVRDVFRLDFDLAVASRQPPQHFNPKEELPFNCGVVWVKSWQVWDAMIRVAPHGDWGYQIALGKVARGRVWKTLILPETYNYTPRGADEDTSHAQIVHLKGERFKWLEVPAEHS